MCYHDPPLIGNLTFKFEFFPVAINITVLASKMSKGTLYENAIMIVQTTQIYTFWIFYIDA